MGVDPEQVQVSVPQVSHLFRLPWLQDEVHTTIDCYRDVACDESAEQISRATALILFTDADGETGTCTGTLLADADTATEIPYLLTAHHCVSDQPKASSVETVWEYRARECDGPAEAPLWVRGGADLLAMVTSADSSLLRLRHTPPEGAAFVRWSTALPLEGEPVVSVHHPHGAPQKITEGGLKDYLHCEDAAYCGEDADPDGIHYLSVAWTAGVTDSGSSGSGLFLASTGELIGVLSGGLSSCENLEGMDDYGWLGLAYREKLNLWLGQASESPR
ncbi:serine protease [Lamprobacter sp.]|uniref:trypsin-like serine peptidase n=1 Tax=Lamprobacter sp. TaxID=3100796 RepID=UPI002B263B36|nr:serine protease [Lamprobacter sp.]